MNDPQQNDPSPARMPLDLDSTKTVPALALQLFDVMTAETARAQNVVIDNEKKRADAAEAHADKLSEDLHAIRQIHEMLNNPFYARRLIMMLKRGDFGEDDFDR